MSRHFAWLSAIVATAWHVLRPRSAPNCVRGVVSRNFYTNGSLVRECFANVVQEVPVSPAVHWIGAIFALLLQSEDFPGSQLIWHHLLSRSIWKQSDNPLATSSDTSYQHFTTAPACRPSLAVFCTGIFKIGQPLLIGSFLICISSNMTFSLEQMFVIAFLNAIFLSSNSIFCEWAV